MQPFLFALAQNFRDHILKSLPENSMSLMDVSSTADMMFVTSEAVFCARNIFVFGVRRIGFRCDILVDGWYLLDSS